jgi:dihydrodipicolinate synthase/N-acetylneuraminate lyase
MNGSTIASDWRSQLRQGIAIPAHPLALTKNRKLDERRQRALTRYYIAAGVGGLAIGVHTTQFAIRDPRHGLFKPGWELASEELQRYANRADPVVRIGGVCGETRQAMEEASLLADLRYNAALLSLASLKHANDEQLLQHCREVASIMPIIGFYLQPSVGGRVLSYSFWRQFAEIENVVAIKIAPFNRYQTLDVVRSVMAAGRDDIALYTGNDDNIVADLVTTFRFDGVERRIVGGLLGHWSVWTKGAVEMLAEVQGASSTSEVLRLGVEITDCNAAFFDSANGFRGCIAGLHEVLRRQGLFEGIWCLDETETLSVGQQEEIDRVYAAYPHLNDDLFVASHLDTWLA